MSETWDYMLAARPLPYNLCYGAKDFSLFSKRPFQIRVFLIVLWCPFSCINTNTIVWIGLDNVNFLNYWNALALSLYLFHSPFISSFLETCPQKKTWKTWKKSQHVKEFFLIVTMKEGQLKILFRKIALQASNRGPFKVSDMYTLVDSL